MNTGNSRSFDVDGSMRLADCLVELACHCRWALHAAVSHIRRYPPELRQQLETDTARFEDVLQELTSSMCDVEQFSELPHQKLFPVLCSGVLYLVLGEAVLIQAPPTMQQFVAGTAHERDNPQNTLQANTIAVRWFSSSNVLHVDDLLSMIAGVTDPNQTAQASNESVSVSGGEPPSSNSQREGDGEALVSSTQFASEFEAQSHVAQHLMQLDPFFLGAHIWMLRALLTRYCLTVVDPASIFRHVALFDPKAAISHDGSTIESAVLSWMKAALKAVIGSGTSPSRGKSGGSVIDGPQQGPPFDLENIDDLYLHTNDGRLLCLLLHHYRGDASINIDEIFLGNPLTVWQRQDNWAAITEAARHMGLWPTLFSDEIVSHGFATLHLHVLKLVLEMFVILAADAERRLADVSVELDNSTAFIPLDESRAGGPRDSVALGGREGEPLERRSELMQSTESGMSEIRGGNTEDDDEVKMQSTGHNSDLFSPPRSTQKPAQQQQTSNTTGRVEEGEEGSPARSSTAETQNEAEVTNRDIAGNGSGSRRRWNPIAAGLFLQGRAVEAIPSDAAAAEARAGGREGPRPVIPVADLADLVAMEDEDEEEQEEALKGVEKKNTNEDGTEMGAVVAAEEGGGSIHSSTSLRHKGEEVEEDGGHVSKEGPLGGGGGGVVRSSGTCLRSSLPIGVVSLAECLSRDSSRAGGGSVSEAVQPTPATVEGVEAAGAETAGVDQHHQGAIVGPERSVSPSRAALGSKRSSRRGQRWRGGPPLAAVTIDEGFDLLASIDHFNMDKLCAEADRHNIEVVRGRPTSPSRSATYVVQGSIDGEGIDGLLKQLKSLGEQRPQDAVSRAAKPSEQTYQLRMALERQQRAIKHLVGRMQKGIKAHDVDVLVDYLRGGSARRRGASRGTAGSVGAARSGQTSRGEDTGVQVSESLFGGMPTHHEPVVEQPQHQHPVDSVEALVEQQSEATTTVEGQGALQQSTISAAEAYAVDGVQVASTPPVATPPPGTEATTTTPLNPPTEQPDNSSVRTPATAAANAGIIRKLKQRHEMRRESLRANSQQRRPSSESPNGGMNGGSPIPVINSRNNKQVISQALKMVCLPGYVNRIQLQNCLVALEGHQGCHFVVLLRDENSMLFKALYGTRGEDLTRVFGVGPQVLSTAAPHMRTMKYETGTKRFVPLPSSSFSAIVDAIAFPLTKTPGGRSSGIPRAHSGEAPHSGTKTPL